MTSSLLSAIPLLFVASLAAASEGTRGGGDICEMEYQGLAAEATKAIDSLNLFLEHDKIDSLSVAKLIQDADVKCQSEPLVLDGIEKTAITDLRTGKVQVHQGRWSAAPPLGKLRIAVHEALVYLRIEKTGDYRYSGAIWPDPTASLQELRCLNENGRRRRGAESSSISLDLQRSGNNEQGVPVFSLVLTARRVTATGTISTTRIRAFEGVPCVTHPTDARLLQCLGSMRPGALAERLLETSLAFTPDLDRPVDLALQLKVQLPLATTSDLVRLSVLARLVPGSRLSGRTLLLRVNASPGGNQRSRSGCLQYQGNR